MILALAALILSIVMFFRKGFKEINPFKSFRSSHFVLSVGVTALMLALLGGVGVESGNSWGTFVLDFMNPSWGVLGSSLLMAATLMAGFFFTVMVANGTYFTLKTFAEINVNSWNYPVAVGLVLLSLFALMGAPLLVLLSGAVIPLAAVRVYSSSLRTATKTVKTQKISVDANGASQVYKPDEIEAFQGLDEGFDQAVTAARENASRSFAVTETCLFLSALTLTISVLVFISFTTGLIAAL